jgi:hypothetical protein
MDRNIMIRQMQERKAVLKYRIKCAVSGRNDRGEPVSKAKAYQDVTVYKKELNTCRLLEELMTGYRGDELILSEEASIALLRIIEPIERHRSKYK